MEKDILKKRWEKIDQEIKKFNGKFNYDIKQRIRRVLKELGINNSNLFSYLDSNDLAMFRAELQDNLSDDMSDYLKYRINKMLTRSKVKYNEALELLIEIAYYNTIKRAEKSQDELFNAVCIITSEMVQKESYGIKKHIKPFHLIPLPNYLLPHIMSTPLYLGYNWLEYQQNMIQYNANKMYRYIIVDIQQNRLDINLTRYDNTFRLERKRYLTALDNEVASICSQVSLWGMEKQGIKKVQYVAVLDEKTTNICQSMHGQIFNVNDWNTYYRYENNDDIKTSKYTTFGLQIGENQPALHYNCRSVLIPYK